jgi:hypothetical protein
MDNKISVLPVQRLYIWSVLTSVISAHMLKVIEPIAEVGAPVEQIPLPQ